MRVPIRIVKDPIDRCSRSDIKTRGEEVSIIYNIIKKQDAFYYQTSVIFSRCKPADDVVYSFGFNKDIERFTVLAHSLPTCIPPNLKRFTVYKLLLLFLFRTTCIS